MAYSIYMPQIIIAQNVEYIWLTFKDIVCRSNFQTQSQESVKLTKNLMETDGFKGAELLIHNGTQKHVMEICWSCEENKISLKT